MVIPSAQEENDYAGAAGQNVYLGADGEDDLNDFIAKDGEDY